MIEIMEIVAIQNEKVYPSKEKYHVCVYQNWFFLINSQAEKFTVLI